MKAVADGLDARRANADTGVALPPMTLPHDIDWSAWTPRDTATLLFVIRGGEVLLIRKKRGLGAGKVNAPGGRLEPGETPAEAAVRELREEVGVTVTSPRARGELRFQFVDGYSLHCHVFTADACEGAAVETDEAVPMWVRLDEIPYAEMWADDAMWLPRMLSGYGFSGRFVFDGDAMRSHDLTLDDPAEALFAALAAQGIPVETVAHPPVFTVEQARRHRNRHDGVHIKNLFVRNKPGAMWLLTLREDRAVDLQALARRLGAGRFTFGSPERLRRTLGVEPGSVTPLAALRDRDGEVTVVLDAAVRHADAVHCHPLTNDRTTTLRGDDLARFLASTGHAPVVLDLDAP